MQRRLRGRIVSHAPAERGYAGQGRSVDRSGPVSEIVVEVELENAGDRGLARRGYLREADVRRVAIPAVADTGAMMLALPEDVVDRLGVRRRGSIDTTYADGRRDELPVAGALIVRIGNRSAVADCIVLPQGSEARIGQIVTRQLDLVPDYANQTLGPRPESPDRPMTRL